MTKITSFKNVDFKAVRTGMNDALKAYGDSVGITFEIGNISFTEGEFDAKIKSKIVGAESSEDKQLKMYMKLWNLQETGYRGRKLVGFLPRCRSAQFIFTDPAKPGKKFRCEDQDVREWFAKPSKVPA